MSADVESLVQGAYICKAEALLKSLVPRAQSFSYYDLDRHCAWQSEAQPDYEIENFVAGLPDGFVSAADDSDPYLRRTLSSGRTLLALPVGDRDGVALGLLVVAFSKNAGKSSWFNPATLYSVLQPAVDVIGESLHVSGRLGRIEHDYRELEKELRLIYEVDEKIHTMSRSHAGLAQLVGQSGRFLGIAYSVLLMPGKRIRISATHSSWKNVNRKVLDRYLVDHMLSRLDGAILPMIFEIPAVEGSNNAADQGYQTLICPLTDQQGNVEGMLALLGRVSGEPFTQAHRRFMAHIIRKIEYVIEQSFDSMTGLMNRAGFEAQLAESWKNLGPEGDTHQLIYMDLDNLQLVNDTFGRAAGDAVIKRFARLLEDDLPKSAVVSRLTGDDFCVLLTHANTDDALEFAREVRGHGDTLRYLEGDRSLQVTVSIGIAECGRRSGDTGRALTTARMACESAKDHGRDRIEVYDEQNQSMIRRHDDMHLVAQIQQTLDADGFELLAQPIASLGDRSRRPRYEILLRMADSDGNPVSTTSLFSAAERYQLMPQIDRWVVSRTIARLAAGSSDVDLAGAVFSINLSGQSLSDDDILEFIEEEIREAGLPAAMLGFEVTESAAVSNLAKAQQLIDALRGRGCSIALDDFGAGLSSFAYLKSFQVDTLKIDGGFIRDIADNRISESMVAAITQVAKVMELETVAEYVESDAARKRVSELGVDFAQGHAIGRPVPLADVLQSLRTVEATTA